MLSKNQIKYYSSLRQKKFRKNHGVFLAEGDKIVREFILDPGFFKIKTLLAVPSFLRDMPDPDASTVIFEITEKELQRISSLTTPNKAVLECEIPYYEWSSEEIQNQYSFYLENIQDPGNLGTIIRTADWFGIKTIFCSPSSVDIYNPKVIQSTMGSIARVRVHYVDATELLNNKLLNKTGYNTVATILSGNDFYRLELSKHGMIFFGNESKGLSPDIVNQCKIKASIPAHPGRSGSDSLNISIAAGIISSELFRRALIQNEN